MKRTNIIIFAVLLILVFVLIFELISFLYFKSNSSIEEKYLIKITNEQIFFSDNPLLEKSTITENKTLYFNIFKCGYFADGISSIDNISYNFKIYKLIKPVSNNIEPKTMYYSIYNGHYELYLEINCDNKNTFKTIAADLGITITNDEAILINV